MKLCILDEREIWHGPLVAAARARGYDARRIQRGAEASGPGIGFIRPHADPAILPQNWQDFLAMRSELTMIQDAAQVEVYEDKSEQVRRWGSLMPPSWRFDRLEDATRFVLDHDGPLVSKADVGASSKNVRILRSRSEQLVHLEQLFGPGIVVDHCSGVPRRTTRSVQRGYVLLQEFVPHDVTWRVNIIGRAWAIFRRFNFPDRPVAQTGNVEPVMRLDNETESLLEFAANVVDFIDSRWCALDILKTESGGWRLIETSLAWPWPSPGECMNAPFFGETSHRWSQIWELLLDEFEAGAWSRGSGRR